MLLEKIVVAGLGEIGSPIFKIISKVTPAVGYDIDQKLVDKKKLKKYQEYETSILHVCIPFNKKFQQNVLSLFKKFKPRCIVIHSTISPKTTKKQTHNDMFRNCYQLGQQKQTGIPFTNKLDSISI